MTGGHGLVVACIKPLLHQQLHHALAHAVVEAFGGSPTDHPRSEGRSAAEHTAPRQDVIEPTPETRRQPEPGEPLWLCLVFVSKLSPRPGVPRSTAIRPAAEGDAAKSVVLPPGDDAFLRALPEVLRGSSVTEVDVPTAQTLRDQPRGQHFVLTMEGVGLGTVQTHRGSQAAYQHPGCRTGRCAPPGSPPCRCPCGVCRPELAL
jgi:hypothetical protein